MRFLRERLLQRMMIYIEKQYPKAKIESTGFWWRIWFKRFIIKEVQEKKNFEVTSIQQKLDLTTKRIKTLNDGIQETEDQIEEVKVNTTKRKTQNQQETDNIEYEIQECENQIKEVIKQRQDLKDAIQDKIDKIGIIDEDIVDKKEIIIENQKEIIFYQK